MSGQVLSNGDFTDSFNISNGVKQGCVLAAVLFNLYFTQALSHAVKDVLDNRNVDSVNKRVMFRHIVYGSKNDYCCENILTSEFMNELCIEMFQIFANCCAGNKNRLTSCPFLISA